MIIDSDFKDYYDTVSTYGGVDKSIVYHRRTIIKKIRNTEKIRFSHVYITLSPRKRQVFTTGILYFCGVVYPHLVLTYNASTTVFWESPEMRYDDDVYKKKFISEFFNTPKRNDDVNILYRSPVVLLHEDELVINPSLKDLQFYKIKDPFATFQEIEMYLGSTLCSELKPNPENVEDKYKITNHGFDPKWSFRKMKDER